MRITSQHQRSTHSKLCSTSLSLKQAQVRQSVRSCKHEYHRVNMGSVRSHTVGFGSSVPKLSRHFKFTCTPTCLTSWPLKLEGKLRFELVRNEVWRNQRQEVCRPTEGNPCSQSSCLSVPRHRGCFRTCW